MSRWKTSNRPNKSRNLLHPPRPAIPVEVPEEAIPEPEIFVVLRGIHPLCDDEVLRAIRTARFTPGMQRGRAVKVKMALPVIFRGRR